MSTISAVITSFNEEKKIEKALKSVQWCDEVILVDGQSSDRTVEIARPLVTKLISVPNDPGMMSMRNKGIDTAKGRWIFILDSDEVITPDLAKEIKKCMSESKFDMYRMPRKQYFLGKWVKHSGWYPDYQPRLFKKGSTRYKNIHIHEQLVIDGPVGTLSNALEHYPHNSWSEYIYKVHRNIKFEAGKMSEREKPPSAVVYLLFRPPARFLSILFRLKGILDGWRGVVLAFFAGYHELMVYFYFLKYKQ